MSLIGRPVPRVEDERLLTVGGTYTDDLRVPGALHLVLVRSTVPHARVLAVRTGAAERAPGVVAVLTAADVDLPPLPPEVSTLNQAMPQPVLAGTVVRHVGDPVAAVLARDRATATDAAALVEVDYDSLPPLTDPYAAQAGGLLLHPEAGTNTALKLTFARPPGRSDMFADCPVVVRQRMVNQRVSASPLETRGGVARWDGDRLTYRGGGQAAHLWREKLAAALGVPESGVRVVTPDVGGAFGSKAFPGREDILVAWAARELGAPVRWSETRSENLVAAGHGRAQHQEAELGGTRDGQVLAYRLAVVQDAGAYPRIGAVLPFWTRTMVTGPYLIGKVKFTASSVVTTTAPVGSYRGAGQPEAVAALERMMDRYAAEIGMDPAEVRRRNLIPRDRFPYTALTRAAYDSGDHVAALDRVLEAADYDALRTRQRERRAAGDPVQLGVGLSVFAELTGADSRSEYADVTAHAGGRFTVRVGTCGHGQGHETSWAMLAADVLAVEVTDIDVVQGDTEAVASGGGTGGSRSLQTGGMAVREAALALVEQARRRAATLLRGGMPGEASPGEAAPSSTDSDDATPDSMTPDSATPDSMTPDSAAPDSATLGSAAPAGGEPELVDGRFRLPGAGESLGWAELAETGELTASTTYQPTSGTCANGAHLAVVEVDTETGLVRLVRFVAVDDAGVILNPLIAEGQIHGGLAQGIGQALVEEVAYGADGMPRHRDLTEYAFVTAAELPSFETISMQTPAPGNALGVKGIGESGALGAPPAVQNAVVDALAHLGVRHVDMPATPERVWRAIRQAG